MVTWLQACIQGWCHWCWWPGKLVKLWVSWVWYRIYTEYNVRACIHEWGLYIESASYNLTHTYCFYRALRNNCVNTDICINIFWIVYRAMLFAMCILLCGISPSFYQTHTSIWTTRILVWWPWPNCTACTRLHSVHYVQLNLSLAYMHSIPAQLTS